MQENKNKGMIDINRFFSQVVPKIGNKNKILEELVENAVRASASEVSFEFKEKDTLIACNNGSILHDFSSLLIVAHSDYNNKMIEKTHRPAGIGIMMMLAACEYVIFSSGSQTLTVSSDDFFADENYRSTILKSTTINNTVIEGMKMELKFKNGHEFLSSLVQGSRFSETITISGLDYYDIIDIFVSTENKKIVHKKISNKKIDSHLSKRGAEELSGCEIHIVKKSHSTNAGLIWFGKFIPIAGLSPFLLKVDGEFDLLHPTLPDRTSIIDEKSVIKSVKVIVEKFMKKEIIELITKLSVCADNIGFGTSHFDALLNDLSMKYNLNHLMRWNNVCKDSSMTLYPLGTLYSARIRLNRASYIGDDFEELTEITDYDCDEISCVSMQKGLSIAPKWVLDRLMHNDPIVEIVRSKKATEASRYTDYYNFEYCESITIDGKEVSFLEVDNQEAIFYTDSFDEYDYSQKLFKDSDFQSSYEVSEDVDSDLKSIKSAYTQVECRFTVVDELHKAIKRTYNLSHNVELDIANIDLSNESLIIATSSCGEIYKINTAKAA